MMLVVLCLGAVCACSGHAAPHHTTGIQASCAFICTCEHAGAHMHLDASHADGVMRGTLHASHATHPVLLRPTPCSNHLLCLSMPHVAAIYYPEGVTTKEFLPRMLAQNVIVAGGLLPELSAKYFRVGHMGLSSIEETRGHITLTMAAVRAALEGVMGSTLPAAAPKSEL